MPIAQYDYESIKAELTSRLESKLNGRILSNSTAAYLIDIIAERFSQMAAYGEYLTRESKWSLAQNTSSILSQIDLFGYKPHRKKGASGFVTVSTDPNFTTRWQYNILIPKFTQFSDGSHLYCSIEDAVLLNTKPTISIPVVQGEVRTTGKFRGNSFSGDTYTINEDSIENNTYELCNNETVCKEVKYFGESRISVNGEASDTDTANDFEYKINNLPDFSGIQIEFASGSHDAEDEFEFTYLITDGEYGSCFDRWSVSTPNSGITQVVSKITDYQGSLVKLYVKNENAISGGTGYESLNDIKTNAPYSFTRVDKIITRNDYIAAIKEIAADCIFNIWTEASLKYNNDIVQMNEANDFINNSKIFFSGVTYDISRRTITDANSTSLLSEIATKLNPKKGVTDYFVLDPADIFKFYINGKVYYDRSKISEESIRSQIIDTIYNTYPVEKAKFKDNIYRSNYSSLFNNIIGINHVDSNIVVYTEIPFEVESNYVVTNNQESRKNFWFTPADASEVAFKGYFIFTSIDNKTGEEPSLNLVKDLFMLKKTGNDWVFYKMDGTTNLMSTITWLNIDGNIDTDGILRPFSISIATNDGKDIYYGAHDGSSTGNGLDSNGMICRFIPENFNCSFGAENQVVIYTDAEGDGAAGVLNPWKSMGSENDWYDAHPNDLEKYGIGIQFEAE